MTNLIKITCWCGLLFAMPRRLYDSCQDNSKRNFFCPMGHSNVFKESESDKLRRECNLLRQRIAREQDEAKHQKKQASLYQGQITKLKKRIQVGVCPSCHRHFKNLERHMKSKHSH